MIRRTVVAVMAIGVMTASLSGCGRTRGTAEPSPPEPDAVVFPGATWRPGDAEELGFDLEVLDDIAQDAEAAGTECLVVVRDGQVAAQWYWENTTSTTPHEVFSITKSFAATLVGLAVADGDLRLDQPASDTIEEWRDGPSEDVTVANLLSHDSGRARVLGTDFDQLTRAEDRTAYAVGVDQVAPPGTVWAYNNSAVQALEDVLPDATGVEPLDMARDRIFEPIGMEHSTFTLDRSGRSSLAFGMKSTCLDLARFGWLMLQGGKWRGRQVLPEGWVSQATSPSTELNVGYGYLWWLNRKGRIVPTALATSKEGDEDPFIGQAAPGAPEGMYWALGLGNQVLQVDPESRTVVVRLGLSEGEEKLREFREIHTARVVTEALTS